MLTIDGDPIFRLGLRVACEQDPDWEVVAELSRGTEAWRILEARSIGSFAAKKPADLGILAVETLNLRSGQTEALAFCRELKSLYPNLPLLLLGGPLTPELLVQVQEAGANGYCPKGRDISLTIEAIRAVASGRTYWATDAGTNPEIGLNAAVVQTVENSAAIADKNPDNSTVDTPVHKKMLAYFCLSGLREIDATLAVVQADLQEIRAAAPTDLPSILDGVVLSGRRRELLAARWVVSQLLFEGKGEKAFGRKQKAFGRKQRGEGRGEKEEIRGENLLNSSQLPLANSQVSAESLVIATNWQSSLFNSAAGKLQFDLVNLTGLPLEIDILRSTKKRELMSSILRKLEDLLEELRFSQVQQTQL